MTSLQPPPPAARARCWSLDAATAWIDATVAPGPRETVALAELGGRVLAADIAAPADEPPHARAVSDGLAVRADDLVGASSYNPLVFRLAAGDPLAPGTTAPVSAGDPLPRGADAVVPLDYVHASAAQQCEIVEAVAPGTAVETAGSHVRRGGAVFAAGRRLSAADIGILAQLGIDRAAVVRRPRIGIVLASHGLDSSTTRDADGPMLERLIHRDGGIAVPPRVAREESALRAALAGDELDAVFVVGGTGRGPNDRSAAVLAEAGEVAVGEIALYPGGSTVLGRTAPRTFVGLLPGRPAACLWAYELIVGRAVRRLGGRDPALPFATRTFTLARKIVSAIGTTEIWPLRLTGAGQIEPVTAAPRDSLLALASADGFVVVPEASEGIPAGATAQVYLHGSS